MHIAIVADAFPPLKNSAAVLVFSLAEALAAAGHQLLVITPCSDLKIPHLEEDFGVFKVVRIRCGKIKSHKKFMRGINELSLFFTFPREFKNTPHALDQWDAIIWYSPSIFLSGLVGLIKKRSRFSYLILRDIVPDWMVDIGLMKKGPSYWMLKLFERYQYCLADIIGVQSAGNKYYIEKLSLRNLKKIEVLPNWMPSIANSYSSSSMDYLGVNLQNTLLAGKKVLIYAGNIGEAQGVENFAQLILNTKNSLELGFLIIGRGSKKEWLQDFLITNNILNVLVLDEVDLITLDRYYRQCYAGLVFLDPKHRSHNIPGKFISYLEASLPVMAYVNPGNDLIKAINDNDLGLVADNLTQFSSKLGKFIVGADISGYRIRTRKFYEAHYQPYAIGKQILAAFQAIESS